MNLLLFFAQRCFVLFRSLFFLLLLFLRVFFSIVRLTFHHHHRQTAQLLLFLSSLIFFLRFQLVWTLYMLTGHEEEKKNRRKFSSVSKHSFIVIFDTTSISFEKNHKSSNVDSFSNIDNNNKYILRCA
jgi:hypothetical protein